MQRQADVFDTGEGREQIEELKNKSDLVAADFGELVVGESREIFVVHANRAGRGAIEAADQIEERGFAGPGWSDDRDHFTAWNRQRHVAKGDDTALALELLGDAIEVDHTPIM